MIYFRSIGEKTYVSGVPIYILRIYKNVRFHEQYTMTFYDFPWPAVGTLKKNYFIYLYQFLLYFRDISGPLPPHTQHMPAQYFRQINLRVSKYVSIYKRNNLPYSNLFHRRNSLVHSTWEKYEMEMQD